MCSQMYRALGIGVFPGLKLPRLRDPRRTGSFIPFMIYRRFGGFSLRAAVHKRCKA